MAKIRKVAGKTRSQAGKPTRAVPARHVPAQKPQADEGDNGSIKIRKTYLNRKELDEFREMLLAKRRSLMGDLSGMAEQTIGTHETGNLSSMPTHMADVGTDNFEHEFTLGLLESEQALLREINEALQRIDDKTYGICMGTGEPIPKARLIAKPWAKYTVDYARKLEKGLVRPPQPERGGEEEESAETDSDSLDHEEEIVDEEPEQEE